MRIKDLVPVAALVAVVLLALGCPGSQGNGDHHPAQDGLGGADGPAAPDGLPPADGTDGTGQPDTLKPPGFTKGNIFVAGSRNAEVFELDPTLKLVTRWTHPSFGTILPPPGQSLTLGPAGMAFDAKGYLVVAAYKEFCVFQKPNTLYGCHPKIKAQPTENVIFDHLGNLYTTTSTGGTNEVHKYSASYKHITTFSIKTGELTGITCDPQGNLYIASQDSGSGHIYKVDRTSFTVIDTIDLNLGGIGTPEGIQYTKSGGLLVATFGGSQGILNIKASSPLTLLGSIKSSGIYGAVPITIDNSGKIYTADYENGSGSLPADLFVFDSAGKVIAQKTASAVYGPFGMVVAGTVLPCGAYRIY